MTYTHHHRINSNSRCYIIGRLRSGDMLIQVEGSATPSSLPWDVFRRRWAKTEAPPVAPASLELCSCGSRAMERINDIALCAECAELERNHAA